MKTIEEKAKAYDKALERANDILKGYNPKEGSKATINYIFPELHEGKDERIRKEILEYFQQFENEELRGVDISDWIDWLEKQGVHANFRHKIQIGDKVTRNKNGILVNISQLNRVAKQGKQKPIEWKQENREELTEFENAMMHIGGSFFGENAGLDPNDTDTIKEQAELLLELAPKTEWSEEDEYTLNETIQHLEELIRIDKAKHCSVDVQYYQRDINWLKSLKPQNKWKPNDEQMEALANALSLAKNCGEEYSFDLRTLYEQLKKLKEE